MAQRILVGDTESTGLEVENGDRVIEIGLVEVVDRRVTGNRFHVYLNPERAVDPDALRVHGISDDFLADKPLFRDVAQSFVDFIGEDVLVFHNAAFDVRFLNAELGRAGYAPLQPARVVDSMELARKQFPGRAANLDALCRRLGVDVRDRELHGALKDALLLAEVYIRLIGGTQGMLDLAVADNSQATLAALLPIRMRKIRRIAPTAAELEAHAKLLDGLTDPIWRRELATEKAA
jgi:DNA polymerase-3 subunit epsilon